MSFVMGAVEIMEVVVHLHRRKLSFVNDVLIAQRANVKPFMKADFMCTLLTKHIKLSLEILLIKVIGRFWTVPWAVGRFKHDNGLKNERLFG
jgi:hypothetical protein